MPLIRRGELSAGEAASLMLPRDVGSRVGRWCVGGGCGGGWGLPFVQRLSVAVGLTVLQNFLDRWELAQNLPTDIVKACPGIF